MKIVGTFYRVQFTQKIEVFDDITGKTQEQEITRTAFMSEKDYEERLKENG